jgi:hypothetical protein
MRARHGWLSLASLSAFLWACGAGGASGSELASRTVGPEGGTVAVSGGDLDGFRLKVPAQAVSAPTVFTVREVGEAPQLAPLPPGFAAFNPMIRIAGGSAAFTGTVALTFPLSGLPAEADKILSAFFYDEARAAWVMVLPKAVGAREVTVETGHLGYWRWGFTLLDEVDGATLEPTMVELYGQAFYDALQAAVHEKFDTLVTPQVLDIGNWSNCDKLLALAGFIKDVADGASADLQSMLGQTCGGCSVGAEVFMDELTRYVGLRMKNLLVDQMINLCDLPFFLALTLKLGAASAFHAVENNLSCDYKCLIDSSPPGLAGDLATYFLAVISSVIVQVGYQYDGCAAPVSSLSSSAP